MLTSFGTGLFSMESCEEPPNVGLGCAWRIVCDHMRPAQSVIGYQASLDSIPVVRKKIREMVDTCWVHKPGWKAWISILKGW